MPPIIGFLLASALGTAFVLHGLWKDSSRAVRFSLLAFVAIPVLVWRLAFDEKAFPLASYGVAAISLALTILAPAYFAHGVARFVGSRQPRRAIDIVAVAVVAALVVWVPLVLLGGTVGTCGLDWRCDP